MLAAYHVVEVSDWPGVIAIIDCEWSIPSLS